MGPVARSVQQAFDGVVVASTSHADSIRIHGWLKCGNFAIARLPPGVGQCTKTHQGSLSQKTADTC
ncbi:hypothetical protein D3C76_1542410 [compost metagenome]